MRTEMVLLVVLLMPLSASALSLDLSPSLSRAEIPPGGNATLNLSLRTSEAVPGVVVEVSAPSANPPTSSPKLEITPARREVGPVGPGEERGPYSFALVDRGLDPGTYKVRINASAGGETRSVQVELRVNPAASPKTPGFEGLAGALALGAALALFKVRRREG